MRFATRFAARLALGAIIALATLCAAAAAQQDPTVDPEQVEPAVSEVLAEEAAEAPSTDDSNDPPPLPADDAPEADEPASDEPAESVPEEETPAEEMPEEGAASDAPEEPADGAMAGDLPEEPETSIKIPEPTPLEAASFGGVTPGQTTREQLHKLWGEPKQVDRIPGGVRETFHSEGFEFVRAAIAEDVVESLTLKLTQPMSPESIIEKLQVADVEPVEVFGDDGRLLGYAFAERGMLFGFDPQSARPRVAQIVIEPISADTFLARAEVRLPQRYTDCLSDLAQAHQLAPDKGRTWWLESEVWLRCGDFEQAVRSAQRAVELEPGELDYRLTLSKVLSITSDHVHAIQHARDVIESKGALPLTLARAHVAMGNAVAAAPQRDFAQAIENHNQAIKLAKPLSRSPKLSVRRAAKEVLLEAYLGAARDIGQGNWQQQNTVAPKWLEQAQTVANDLIANERGTAESRLRVNEGALAALAAIAEPPDAAKWIAGLQDLGTAMVREATDEAYRAHLAWRMGVALGDATEIEAVRGKAPHALELGNMALAYFAKGEAAGKHLPTHDYLRGWLCYRMGAIHAIARHDHKQALAWFQQAVPLLESPAPASAAVHPARHGETFVSMAVSYWEQGQREEALRLTQQGLKLMERASSVGMLDKPALSVPYSNLARMYELFGDQAKAQRYSALASQAEALATK